jgi:hypothetical protein
MESCCGISLNETAMAAYKEAFLLIDRDADGLVSVNDLKRILHQVGQDKTAEDVAEIFLSFPGKDGRIDMCTFLRFCFVADTSHSDSREYTAPMLYAFNLARILNTGSMLVHLDTSPGGKLSQHFEQELDADADARTDYQTLRARSAATDL